MFVFSIVNAEEIKIDFDGKDMKKMSIAQAASNIEVSMPAIEKAKTDKEWINIERDIEFGKYFENSDFLGDFKHINVNISHYKRVPTVRETFNVKEIYSALLNMRIKNGYITYFNPNDFSVINDKEKIFSIFYSKDYYGSKDGKKLNDILNSLPEKEKKEFVLNLRIMDGEILSFGRISETSISKENISYIYKLLGFSSPEKVLCDADGCWDTVCTYDINDHSHKWCSDLPHTICTCSSYKK